MVTATVPAFGVVGVEAVEGAPAPAVLVAVTVNVYAVALVRPRMTARVPGAGTVTVAAPGVAVTV